MLLLLQVYRFRDATPEFIRPADIPLLLAEYKALCEENERLRKQLGL
jgi:hypothetical protein